MAKHDNFLTFDEYMNTELKSLEHSFLYLDTAIEEYEQDGDARALLLAIKRVAEAQGGISKLAKETNLNRQNLYKIFNSKISPRFSTLTKILKALGYSITIKKMDSAEGK